MKIFMIFIKCCTFFNFIKKLKNTQKTPLLIKPWLTSAGSRKLHWGGRPSGSEHPILGQKSGFRGVPGKSGRKMTKMTISVKVRFFSRFLLLIFSRYYPGKSKKPTFWPLFNFCYLSFLHRRFQKTVEKRVFAFLTRNVKTRKSATFFKTGVPVRKNARNAEIVFFAIFAKITFFLTFFSVHF